MFIYARLGIAKGLSSSSARLVKARPVDGQNGPEPSWGLFDEPRARGLSSDHELASSTRAWTSLSSACHFD